MDLDSLPARLQRLVREELKRDEPVQWAGCPALGRFVLSAIPTAFFGVFVAGFAIVWTAGAYEVTRRGKEMEQRHAEFQRRWKDGDPWGENGPTAPAPAHKPESSFSFQDLFPLFGVLFLVIGLVMVFAPVWAARRAVSTVYVVTDRRAILFDGGWSTHVRSFGPEELSRIERRQRGDGSGDLILAREPEYIPGHYSGTAGRGGHYVPGRWTTREIGFFGISQVKHVEQLLRAIADRRDESAT